MNRSEKMNILYKLGFILMCVCVVLFGAALVCLILLSNIFAGVLISAVGSALCLAAIILTLLSKPRKPKPKKEEVFENAAESVLTENSADVIIEPNKGE